MGVNHTPSRLPAMPFHKVTSVGLPVESAVNRACASADLMDAFQVALPPGASDDPERLARFMFSSQPRWVNALMRLRDAIVGPLKLKTGAQLAAQGARQASARVGLFRIYSKDASEIVLGEDDAHLDFRVAVRCSGSAGQGEGRYLTVATMVHCHNTLGRVYLFVIAPFHRLVVRSTLRRAARFVWPSGAAADEPGTR